MRVRKARTVESTERVKRIERQGRWTKRPHQVLRWVPMVRRRREGQSTKFLARDLRKPIVSYFPRGIEKQEKLTSAQVGEQVGEEVL